MAQPAVERATVGRVGSVAARRGLLLSLRQDDLAGRGPVISTATPRGFRHSGEMIYSPAAGASEGDGISAMLMSIGSLTPLCVSTMSSTPCQTWANAWPTSDGSLSVA